MDKKHKKIKLAADVLFYLSLILSIYCARELEIKDPLTIVVFTAVIPTVLGIVTLLISTTWLYRNKKEKD